MKDKIIYNVASYKRATTLLKTIDSIYNQSDIINVALNDYSEIPVDLYDKKINLIITDNDKGDAYKFYSLPNSNGYFLTIDDDLIYSKNYTEFMIGKIEEYKRQSIITIHGRLFEKFPISSYYNKAATVYHFRNKLNEDKVVNFGGTGVMGFHTDLFKINIDYFKYPNMADIWIGKYAKENNIKIFCVAHDENTVKQQEFIESIYSNDLKNDTLQTEVVNNSFSKKDVSIIIPTYKNTDYIDECLTSIINSCEYGINYEILVGIDNCEETLSYIKNKKFNQNVRFFYFEKNVGPYVIKNTLAKISDSEDIIFFDSDDVMKSNMVTDCIKLLKNYELVKPRLHNFKKTLDLSDKKFELYSSLWGEGVFAIKKSIFLYHNGFEDWRCAADSDLMGRLYKNKIKVIQTEDLMFFRRMHDKNLTVDPATNYGSKLREKYAKISKERKDFGPLPKLVTCKYNEIYVQNYPSSEQKVQEQITKQEKKEKTITDLNQTRIVTKKIVENEVKLPIKQVEHIHTIKQSVKKILDDTSTQTSKKYSNQEINQRRQDIIKKIERGNKNIFF